MIRTLLRAEIEALEPFRITASERGTDCAQPCSTDAMGRVYVPPTSLAGSLRDHLGTYGLASVLMGTDVETAHDKLTDRSTPSPLRLLGSATTAPSGAPIAQATLARRGQTAIDRHRGAADPSTLRTQVESAPAGTIVVLYARLDRELTSEERSALGSWRPTLGGCRSTGMGTAKLRSLRLGTLDMATEPGLRMWMTVGGPELIDRLATTEIRVEGESSAAPALALRFEIVDGLHCGGDSTERETREGEASRPACYHERQRGEAWIEGSSLKGILRSRVEFILRTLGAPVCEKRDCDAGGCLPCGMFGSVNRRGRLLVRSARVDRPSPAIRTHVAIDRITGGARRNLLFSERIIASGEFTLRVDLLGSALTALERGLLEAAVRDLHEGHVGIGSRVSRGLGTVRLVTPAQLPAKRDLIALLEEVSA